MVEIVAVIYVLDALFDISRIVDLDGLGLFYEEAQKISSF